MLMKLALPDRQFNEDPQCMYVHLCLLCLHSNLLLKRFDNIEPIELKVFPLHALHSGHLGFEKFGTLSGLFSIIVRFLSFANGLLSELLEELS